MSMRPKILMALFLLAPCAFSVAQPGQDVSFLAAAKRNAINHYHQALAAQARLYNGSKYRAPEHTLEEHPYFLSEDWIMGSVHYDGDLFENVPLMLDLSQGALVTEHYPSGHPIQLVYGKLQGFSIAGHNFEKIENENVGNSLPTSGFYEVLYAGPTRLVARRQKQEHEQIVSTEIQRSYEERNRYFLFKNGVFFKVKSKRSVRKLLTDKKQEVKRFFKQHKALFYPDREKMLKMTAEYYDSLKGKNAEYDSLK